MKDAHNANVPSMCEIFGNEVLIAGEVEIPGVDDTATRWCGFRERISEQSA